MIKMVISPEYFGKNDKKNDIIMQLKRLGAFGINIDDTTGFVTALMTVDNYESFVEGIKERIIKTAKEIPNKYKGVNYVYNNNDYTVFYVGINRKNRKLENSIVFDLLLVSTTYQVISGIPQANASIKVNFYNKDNKLIDCIDTSGDGN